MHTEFEILSLSSNTGSFLDLGKSFQRETFLIPDGECKFALHYWPVLPRTGVNIGFYGNLIANNNVINTAIFALDWPFCS